MPGSASSVPRTAARIVASSPSVSVTSWTVQRGARSAIAARNPASRSSSPWNDELLSVTSTGPSRRAQLVTR